MKQICSDIWFNIFAKLLWFFQWLSWYPMGLPGILKIRKKIYSRHHELVWQHPYDKWSEAVLDPLPFIGFESYQTWWWTHTIGRNCLLFRTTRVHFRFIGSSYCSCAFVIFSVISVGCCWFVSVLPWFVFSPRLLFVDNPFVCKRLFFHHDKSSNGTFLIDRIMINIPLGTNITIKVPVDIIFHNISSLGSYIMVKLIFRRTDCLFPSDLNWQPFGIFDRHQSCNTYW